MDYFVEGSNLAATYLRLQRLTCGRGVWRACVRAAILTLDTCIRCFCGKTSISFHCPK